MLHGEIPERGRKGQNYITVKYMYENIVDIPGYRPSH